MAKRGRKTDSAKGDSRPRLSRTMGDSRPRLSRKMGDSRPRLSESKGDSRPRLSSARVGQDRPAQQQPITAADLHAALEQIAPAALAEPWDNVGLLLGEPDWPASRVLLTIDLSDAVADEALRLGVEAIVAYHPPIFRGTKTVGPAAEASTSRLAALLSRRISVLAVHTALDAAEGGTNDVLLDAFELAERWPLEPAVRTDATYKLVVFVPPEDVAGLRAALSAAGAGVIGHYSECSFELRGRGTFRGDETTQPAIGRRLQLETVDEVRLEMVVPRARLGAVVRALYAAHRYEEPAFDLYPLHELPGRGRVGMGRVGVLQRPQRGDALVRRLARVVDLSAAMVVGDLKRRFERVVAAAGAFGTQRLTDPDALVITGELKHHEALELLRRGLTAVCVGHHASERPVLDVLRRKLSERLDGLKVRLSRKDQPPLRPLGR